MRDLVSAALPDIASGFVFERAKLLDREFLLEDWRRRESDLLWRIPFRHGDTELETLVCVLLEHQSQPDVRMPLRMLLYAVLYWDREWKAWEALPVPRPDFRLTPIVPIVFHTGERKWNTSRQIADLLAGPELFQAFAPTWPICFWDLAERSPRELLNSTHSWLKALAVPRAGREDLASFVVVLNEAVEQLSVLREQSEVRWYDLKKFMVDWTSKMRDKDERKPLLEMVAKAQESNLVTQETKNMIQSMADAWLEEGMEKGMEKGLSRGMILGRIQTLESLIGLTQSAISPSDSRSDDELLQIETELKATLANR